LSAGRQNKGLDEAILGIACLEKRKVMLLFGRLTRGVVVAPAVICLQQCGIKLRANGSQNKNNKPATAPIRLRSDTAGATCHAGKN